MSEILTRYPWLLFAAAVWTLLWKGPALWKSARRGDTAWFIAILIVNTLGVLEMLYLFVFSGSATPGKRR